MLNNRTSRPTTQFRKNANNPKRLRSDLLESISKRKIRSELPDKFDVDNSTLTDARAIANEFNNYFNQVAPNLNASFGPCQSDPMSYMTMNVSEIFFFRLVNQEAVYNTISGCKDVGAGLDRINTMLMKLIFPRIASCYSPHQHLHHQEHISLLTNNGCSNSYIQKQW